MSSHFFGLWRGRATKAWVQRADEIARKHEAECVPYEPDHEPARGWFVTENLGAPFDQATARAVMADLESEGLILDLGGDQGIALNKDWMNEDQGEEDC